MTAKSKTGIGTVLALLLLLLLWRGLAGEGSAPVAAPRPRGTASAPFSKPTPGEPPPAEPAPALPAAAPAPPKEPGADPPAAPPPPLPATPAVQRLALLPLPRREPAPAPDVQPPPKEGVTIGGGGEGGLVPVGWTKWKPVPEKGSATLAGTVVDAGGRPLAGAEVYRIEEAAGGAEGEVISFQHVRTVATTGEDGAFEARDQPVKPARLAANYHRALNRPRGLLLSGVLPVNPAEGERLAGLQLALPVNRDDFGAVAGRVADDEGNPLSGVRVFAGFQEARIAPDGTFRLDAVPSGDVEVSARRYGYAGWREIVVVSPGQESRVEIVLAPAGTGSGVLRGRVVDAGGSPVAGVRVWCGGAANLSRDATTDAEGRFEFRRLPPGLGPRSLSVSVMAAPSTAGILPATVQGVGPGGAEVVLTVERTVMLRILVRDAGTKEVLPLFNVSLERERTIDGRSEVVPFRSATLHEEDGAWEVPVPTGRLVLFVEAPDHQPVHGADGIPDIEGMKEVLVEMPR